MSFLSFKNRSKYVSLNISLNIDVLICQNWEDLGETENLEEMTNLLTDHVTKSLDECAPRRTFKVRHNHKFGISESTKALINERDKARNDIKSKSPTEKAVKQIVYKKLIKRNKSLLLLLLLLLLINLSKIRLSFIQCHSV